MLNFYYFVVELWLESSIVGAVGFGLAIVELGVETEIEAAVGVEAGVEVGIEAGVEVGVEAGVGREVFVSFEMNLEVLDKFVRLK